MKSLTACQFSEFFRCIYGYDPFPWQERVALRVCDPKRDWPKAIALPTAAGKTGCIDIAVFALACQAQLGIARTAPRRIFFVVDRRIVVDQAFEHAQKKLASALRDATSGIVKLVADQLRELSDSDRPLDVYAMRGGMYRDSGWAASPLQATVIASTVDQVGSRLLFRGYGVSDSARPIHAGLVGNDALILLDEAHCAKPFEQTCNYVEHYRNWGEAAQQPFRQVSITATPINDVDVERDEADDRSHPVLGKRINASKPTSLVVAEKAKGKTWKNWGPHLVAELAKQARSLMGNDLGPDEKGMSHSVKAVGIIVNRVATARELATELKKSVAPNVIPHVILLTGRMRPVDRDEIMKDLEPLISNSKVELIQPVYIVATQCLEVGADLDFHALVTECASLDSLRQRFGRLNRIAARPSSKAVIVIRGDQTDDTSEDPVYGASLANTWKWLVSKSNENVIDLGVAAVRNRIDGVELAPLNVPSADAPVLFPAHLDCWVQTHPIPTPDPDPAVFLHGPQAGNPDVQVVFRKDLGEDSEKWVEIVKLCPPSSSEAVSVPIPVFRKWHSGEATRDETGDIEGAIVIEEETSQTVAQQFLRWSGPRTSEVLSKPSDLRPGDTLVVRVDFDSTAQQSLRGLGDFPTGVPNDCGDEAFQVARDRAILRLLDITLDAESEDFDALISSMIEKQETANPSEWMKRAVRTLKNPKDRIVVKHPLNGWVVTGKRRLRQFNPTLLEVDDSSDSPSGRSVTLVEHSCGVADRARRFAAGCGLDVDLYSFAGYFHDLGKLDPRFQALLKGRSPRTAGGEAWAKSGSDGSGDRDVHQYPQGARHELLSVAMLESHTDDDLLLHLIATHHGSARPFANSVTENAAAQSPFSAELFGSKFKVDTCAQRIAEWNATLANRFWRVIRKFGWWGSAFQEAVFRLADHAQSQSEQMISKPEVHIPDVPKIREHVSPTVNRYPVELQGIDGSNQLGFLAALGTLRFLSECSQRRTSPTWLSGDVKMSWGTSTSPYTPVLHFDHATSQDEILDFLAESLDRDVKSHPVARTLELLELEKDRVRSALREFFHAPTSKDVLVLNWNSALISELAPDATNQLQTVRRDYLAGNLASVMQRTQRPHLLRSLFQTWDYQDGLDNQSLHWDPCEDRRHAYQWYAPTSDPSRKKSGGMLGANRLAIEAWPMFQSWESEGKLNTRGFSGTRVHNTFWTWPLWKGTLGLDAISSILGLVHIQPSETRIPDMSGYGLVQVFRCQRILMGKTPNLTPSIPVR